VTRGIRTPYGNVPGAFVAFAVPPPPDSSFRCEGGSRSPHLRNKYSCASRFLRDPFHRPKTGWHRFFCERDFEIPFKSCQVEMSTVVSAAGRVTVIHWPISTTQVTYSTENTGISWPAITGS